MTETAPVLAFKGFEKDLTCRGFQYREGETYTQDEPAVLCGTGFHAVLQPIDVLRYYRPASSVYHHVELTEVAGPDKSEGDSKIAGRTITIGARIELPALIKAQVEFVMKNSKPVAGATSKAKNAAVSADITNGAATASGDYGAATASGYYGAATASGDSGAATASGDYGAATASGDSGAATASGDSGAATASGDSGAATASGNYGAATASGNYGAATASGNSGAATASGPESVAIVTGKNGRAQGELDSWIVLTERDTNWNILGIKTARVDGKQIKAGVFYKLVDGKVVCA